MSRRSVAALAHADADRCIVLPHLDQPLDREAWLDAATEAGVAASAHWELTEPAFVRATVEHALSKRAPQDVLALQLWPDDAPIAGVVRVSTHDAEGLEAVAARLASSGAARIDRIDGAMGAGCEWLHLAPIPGESEDGLVGWQAVFAGDEVDVLVTLEPTVPQLLPALLDDARALAADLVIEVDGRPMRALALPERLGLEVGESWAPEDDA
ncbi:hypothetical protein [Agrococcus jenensis]|uniref:Uncharacterized protein n=1 Tax=Agrococcus jenensis TaxID=46353 RepID=A0A3N2ASH2_9MICO|nr:hypothetical protein [Agrococcus jenensis]ROR65993.1 hypothetical protein EDD26_1368 [Agrococcus jenensis]